MMDGQHDQVAAPGAPRSPRSKAVRGALIAGALLLIVLFAGLGTWQVYRLQWKLDLIARVDARVHAAPVAAPSALRWEQVSRNTDEYRHVRLAGTYLYEFTTPVQALSELGSGFWLLTPLCQADGTVVLVNRGFIPVAEGGPKRYPARRAVADACRSAKAEPVTLTGLLRISEPGGGFLRNNDPAGNRWFSRDVGAIAAARGLSNVAPYFVDAGARMDPPGAPQHPVGGLTVISFPNTHLIYALTWYALALMAGGAWWWIARGAARHNRSGQEREDDRQH
jgi:surfeit locus 1 family protein